MDNFFDVIIIGGGVSGSMIASQVKNKKVAIFNLTYNNKSTILKKILVSGNGRCNFFNTNIKNVLPFYLENSDINNLFNYFDNNGFAYYQNEEGLYYPFFNKSDCMYFFLLNKLKQTKTKIIEKKVNKIDYKNKLIYCSDDNYKYDKLVISTGGRSYNQEDFNYDLINSLDVDYYEFKPCLCPIKTKEQIDKILINNKLKCEVTLLSDSQIVYSELGEIIFKNDGLSGICIFNISFYINELLTKTKNRNIKIKINPFKHNKAVTTYNKAKNSLPLFLDGIINSDNELIYTFKDFYSFKDSQVSYGGILLSEIDASLMLKKRKDIYVSGEIINRNFPCGGYNIGISLLEGFKLGNLLNGR